MSRFIESIQLRNGELVNLPLHEVRMRRTIEAYYKIKVPIDLTELKIRAKEYPTGLYKCRVLYAKQLQKIEIKPYQIRPINSLQLVESQLDYSLKYEDRTVLNHLFAQRGTCEDVLIVKNGFITDGSYTNVAFFDGQTWWTPTTPLLKGVQRQQFLNSGLIQEKSILATTIFTYKKVKLFNAMMNWEDALEVPIHQIKALAF